MMTNLICFFNGLLMGAFLALIGSMAIIKNINNGGGD